MGINGRSDYVYLHLIRRRLMFPSPMGINGRSDSNPAPGWETGRMFPSPMGINGRSDLRSHLFYCRQF